MLVADVPWAYPNSGFTRSFDLTTAWLAMYLPRSVVSEYMRIDWETVGNCIHRATNDIEPDRRRRLDGLVNIGIDETGETIANILTNHSMTLDEALDLVGAEPLEAENSCDPDYILNGVELWYDDLDLVPDNYGEESEDE